MESMLFLVHQEDDLPLVRQQLRQLLQGLLGPQAPRFEAACTQALDNAIRSSSQTFGAPLVRIRIALLGKRHLSIRILDYGDGFPGNTLLRSLPAEIPLSAAPADAPETVLGLPLMKDATDQLLYNHLGNEILLIKTLPA